MNIFKRAYDFYDLSEQEQSNLVGQMFKEPERETIYFPIEVSNPWTNYNHRFGLVFLSPIWTHQNHPVTKVPWFRVGVKSPDDYDYDLDFEGDEIKLHEQVKEFLTTTNKRKIDYRDLIKEVQKHFNAGRIS